MNFYHIDADALLAQIPAELRDVPRPELGGETPTQAAQHIRDTACLACRHLLQDLIPPKPEPVDRFTQDRAAGGVA